MAIHYNTIDVRAPKIERREITNWIKQVATQHQKRVGEITYIFCSDDEILRINREYLKHDYYTDIITFDYSEKDRISGDLFISLDTVKSNSEQYNTDFIEEIRRVMIHGILHLCGFNDKSPEDEKLMRQKEDKALSLVYSFTPNSFTKK
ncbi:MAG: rRNA maturation RNase YbeY [Dysgonamonadaceae bacterium]|jgi:rRNA maturation RNase YbeY|nr:rRNA maturation RNase YbeY [Dysgonamonadaceae bacterium]